MAKISKPIIYVYKEINVGKYSTTKHFELVNQTNDFNKLTDQVKITKDRCFARVQPVYWLHTRTDHKWDKTCLTGLFKTSITNLFIGDTEKKKNLLLFKFSSTADTLTIYCFKNYYSLDIKEALKYLY